MNPIERLTQKLIAGDAKKAALVVSPTNHYYLTTCQTHDGALLITAEKAYYLLDSRYSEAGRADAVGCEVVEFRNLQASVGELIKKHGITTVYTEYATLPYGTAMAYKKTCEEVGAELILDQQLDNAIRAQRIIKSEDEIQRIMDAQAITDATFEHILPYIKEGVTEREIALEIESHMRKLGADGNAFPPIVVTGKNGSKPHGIPGDTVIQKGDLITMDTGAKLHGYNSDMTRTVAVGHVSDEQRDIYNTVLEAQVSAINAIHAGVKCSDVDKVARDLIDAKYPGTFGHGLGHGVGFEIHEWPRFSMLDHTITEPGMVITVEPGIYIAGSCGVRIEDMIVVTETGVRNLTNSPKELIIL